MKASQYNTIMPRVAIENLKLLDISDYDLLICKDIDEIFRFLLTTAYQEEINNTCGDFVDPGLLEDALLQNYAKSFNKLIRDSSKYIKKLLLSILHKFDASNLKTLFRMVRAEKQVEEILKHIIPLGIYNREKCQKILSNNKSIKDIIDNLQNHDFGFFLKDKFKNQSQFLDLSYVEAALDKEVYKGILKTIKKLNRKDKKIATNILGIEIDALNVKIILRYKSLMVDDRYLNENLMPEALFDEKTLELAIRNPDIKSTLQFFLRSVVLKHNIYQQLFTKLVEESESPISRLEYILEKAPVDMSNFELKSNMRYYNIGYILSFLNIKWAEIKNLIRIINASERGVDEDKIRDLLFLPSRSPRE